MTSPSDTVVRPSDEKLTVLRDCWACGTGMDLDQKPPKCLACGADNPCGDGPGTKRQPPSNKNPLLAQIREDCRNTGFDWPSNATDHSGPPERVIYSGDAISHAAWHRAKLLRMLDERDAEIARLRSSSETSEGYSQAYADQMRTALLQLMPWAAANSTPEKIITQALLPPSSSKKADDRRTQVCDCDIGLCCKANRRTNQYCRIQPPSQSEPE